MIPLVRCFGYASAMLRTTLKPYEDPNSTKYPDRVFFAGRWKTPEQIERMREIQKKYRQSEKGKATYRKSGRKYRQTAKGKAAQRKYRQTAKGKAAKRRHSRRAIRLGAGLRVYLPKENEQELREFIAKRKEEFGGRAVA